MTNLDSVLKSRDVTLLTKAQTVKITVFPVVMYGCESWTIRAPNNWCFQNMMLEKTLESPLDSKEIKSINPKGNKPWIFTRRTDAESEAPILWPPVVKSLLTGKDPDARKDWGQEEKGMTGDEMAEGTIDSTDMSLSKLQETMKDREAWRSAAHGVTKNQTQQRDWTTTNGDSKKISSCLESGERSWWIGGTQRIFRTVKLFCMIL